MKRLSNGSVGFLTVCTLALVMLAGCDINIILTPSHMEQADSYAKAQDPDAIIYEASGMSKVSADCDCETTQWAFYATNPDNGDPVWEITYDGETWAVSQFTGPVGSAAYYDLTQVTMTDTEATQLLLKAGHDNDFAGWNLSQPLQGDCAVPLYSFIYSDKVVTVNTETEAVGGVSTEFPVTGTNGVPSDDSVSVQMIANAEAYVVENINSNAFVVRAGGRDGDGNTLTQAGDTNVWDFLVVLNSETEVRAWVLTYDGTWTSNELAFPPFGVEFTSLSYVTMDVVEAWTLAVDAGYGPTFNDWSIFKSLHPSIQNAMYVFPHGGGFVLVDVVTGQVTFE